MSTITFTKIFKIEKYINFNFQVLSIQSLSSSAKILKTKMKIFINYFTLGKGNFLGKDFSVKTTTYSSNNIWFTL